MVCHACVRCGVMRACVWCARAVHVPRDSEVCRKGGKSGDYESDSHRGSADKEIRVLLCKFRVVLGTEGGGARSRWLARPNVAICQAEVFARSQHPTSARGSA